MLTFLSSQMQIAIDTRTVEKDDLFRICAGRIICGLAVRLMYAVETWTRRPLTARIKRYYSVELFHARARLDLPTYESTSIQRQLDEASQDTFNRTVAWETLDTVLIISRAGMQLVAQTFVLWEVLREQRDGVLLAFLTLSSQGTYWLSSIGSFQPARGTAFSLPELNVRLTSGLISLGGDYDERRLCENGRLEACGACNHSQKRGGCWQPGRICAVR